MSETYTASHTSLTGAVVEMTMPSCHEVGVILWLRRQRKGAWPAHHALLAFEAMIAGQPHALAWLLVELHTSGTFSVHRLFDTDDILTLAGFLDAGAFDE